MYQNQLNFSHLTYHTLDLPTPNFPQRQFQINRILGDGGEGIVYEAQPLHQTFYNNNIAIKIQSILKNDELKFINEIMQYQENNEKAALKKSNIIRLYEVLHYQNKQLILMELGGKNLYTYLKENNIKEFNKKRDICQQITQAIDFLHSKKQIHRDIKPENFILCGTVFKLIDFGQIKKKDQDIRLTYNVGTPFYQAPEIINGVDDYSFPVDIWSLGCLYFEIFHSTPLFDGNTIDQIKNQIWCHCQNQDIVYNKIDNLEINKELKELIKKMIHPKPQSRPPIEQVLSELLPKISLEKNKQFQIIQSPKDQQYNQQQQFQIQQSQQPKKLSFEEINTKLVSVINDYCEYYQENQQVAILDSQTEEYQELIENIKNETIQQFNNQIKGYLQTKQNQKQKDEYKYNNNPVLLKPKANFDDPKKIQKIQQEDEPQFESYINQSQTYQQ